MSSSSSLRRSEAGMRPASRSARAFNSSGGLNNEPTCSARNGGSCGAGLAIGTPPLYRARARRRRSFNAEYDYSQFRLWSIDLFPYPFTRRARQAHHRRAAAGIFTPAGRHETEHLVHQPPAALARGQGVRQRVVARAGGQVEALVEFVAPGQRRADEIPREPENPRPLARGYVIGSAQELIDQVAQRGVVELVLARSCEQVVRADELDDFTNPRKPAWQ